MVRSERRLANGQRSYREKPGADTSGALRTWKVRFVERDTLAFDSCACRVAMLTWKDRDPRSYVAPLPYKSVGYHAGLSSRILYVDRNLLQEPTKRAETPLRLVDEIGSLSTGVVDLHVSKRSHACPDLLKNIGLCLYSARYLTLHTACLLAQRF